MVSAAGALGLADALGVISQAAQQGDAQARFVRAAVGRGNGVAVGVDEAVLDRHPGDRPFDRAVLAVLLHLAGEDLVDHQFLALDVGGQIVLQAAGEAKHRLRGNLALRIETSGRAAPADFDAAEQIGLRARHLEQALGIEFRRLAENLLVGKEAHLGAAPIGGLADDFELGDGEAALERLPVERLRARHLDFGARPRGR